MIKAIFSTLILPLDSETGLKNMNTPLRKNVIGSNEQKSIEEEEIGTMFFENISTLKEKIIDLVNNHHPRPIIMTMPEHSLYGEFIFAESEQDEKSMVYEYVTRQIKDDYTEGDEVYRYFTKEPFVLYSDDYSKMRYGVILYGYSNIDPSGSRGNIWGNTNLVGSELAKIESLLQKEPNDIKNMYRKGVFLHNLKRYDDAITCYKNILASDPHEIMASYLMELSQKAKIS